MKARILAICIFLLAIPLCYFLYKGTSLSVGQKINEKAKAPNNLISSYPQNKLPDLGSPDYIAEIEIIDKSSGSITAMKRIITDVNKYGYLLGKADHEKVIRLYDLVSGLVSRIGTIDMEIHYFRNKLNVVPHNLSEMISLNKSLTPDKRWRLLPVKGSLYHMQSKGGEYNLKFVSPEGYCEAVYNKQGILLTEFNDPVNMGTFNYAAGMHDKDSHMKYDVDPYLKWGNSINSPQKKKHEIKGGAKAAYDQYLENYTSVDEYRSRIQGLFHDANQSISKPRARPAFNLEELFRFS